MQRQAWICYIVLMRIRSCDDGIEKMYYCVGFYFRCKSLVRISGFRGAKTLASNKFLVEFSWR